MSRDHRCPKCASDQMIDGAYVAGAQGARIAVGVERRPDRDRLTRGVSTQVHASVCGSCGFVEMYANEPERLYEASRQAGHSGASATPLRS